MDITVLQGFVSNNSASTEAKINKTAKVKNNSTIIAGNLSTHSINDKNMQNSGMNEKKEPHYPYI